VTFASLNQNPVAILCQQAPATDSGYPISTGNDWELVVEHLNARQSLGNGAQWGSAKWGPTLSNDKWGALEWDPDLGSLVRGIAIERGADEPYGRPRAGVANITLDDRDGLFNPWDNTDQKIRVGSVIRVGLRSASDTRGGGWLPLFCGIVESDPVIFVGVLQGDSTSDRFVEVTVVEPLAELAQVDDNALGSSIGGGEFVVDRIARLLENGNVWRFGLLDHLGSGDALAVTLQATAMSQNRLTECYLAADSAGVSLRPDRTGALVVEPHWNYLLLRDATHIEDFTGGFVALHPTSEGTNEAADTFRVTYDIDSVESGNDTAHIRNDVRYARAGGTQQTVVHAQSRGRYGRRQMVRNDLICQTDGQSLQVATEDVNKWARIALRVENVTVTATERPEVMLMCAAADIYDVVPFNPPTETGDTEFAIGHIRFLRHDITPMKDRTHWVTSWSVDFRSLSDLPGEELDTV
jgi:hypothetical protein